jgi:hypothetical protein
MYANWNAGIKGAKDGLVTQGAIVLGGAIYAKSALLFVLLPFSVGVDLLSLKRYHSLRIFRGITLRLW